VFEALFKDKLAPLVLRLALGLISSYHGFLKIMVAGGTAWQTGLAVPWQLAIAWGEFAAGLAILVGFRCRWAVTLLLAVTLGNLAWGYGWGIFHLPIASLEPIFMLLLIALALLFLGSGELGLDGRGTAGASGKLFRKNNAGR
jgi:uncharacterized membrane protein YphA (DoxX/SURF4 family)